MIGQDIAAARGRWTAVVVAAVFCVLALRQHLFVDRYAINVMFWDQWDFYQPLFQRGDLWDLFFRQHGPHRQGLGFLLTAVLAEISGWNSRWDAFGVSMVLIVAALLALLLARRCGAGGLMLILVPLLFFNLRQYEIFVGAANISHGAMPMLLLMALCLSWLVEKAAWRYALVTIFACLSIFTGFGLFTGVVVMLLLAGEVWRHRGLAKQARAQWLSLGGLALAWLVFAYDYRFDPAVQGFRFPHERPWEYLLFMASMLNNFFGIRGHGMLPLAIGMALLLFLVYVAALHGHRLVRHGLESQGRSAVIVTLALFALIYCGQTAVGRVVLGWREAAGSSRYVPLMIPAGMALFLHFAGISNRSYRQWGCLLLALLLAAGTLGLHGGDQRFIARYSAGRLLWKGVYLATGDVGKAGELANFMIHPAMEIEQRLDFLRQHHLNLFNPSGRP